MPVGFLRVADAWEWVGPVEDRPAADGNPGSRAATVGNWASNKQIMVDYMAQPASSRAKLAALGVDPVGFFLANGTGVPNVDDPAVYAAVADWQRAIEQTPSFKGEGLFEAFMSSGFVQAAAIAAGIYGLGSFVGGAAAAPLTETATLQAVTSSGAVSSSTAAAFAAPTSTAGLYSAAVQTAINTSVADYAAAAVAGETVGAAAAFTALPVSSLGPAVSAGFLESALEIAKGVKNAVNTVQMVNKATGQRTIVPKNSPVPAGFTIDLNWSPNLGQTVGTYAADPATGAIVLQSAEAVPTAGTIPPGLALAALAGAVFFLVK